MRGNIVLLHLVCKPLVVLFCIMVSPIGPDEIEAPKEVEEGVDVAYNIYKPL